MTRIIIFIPGIAGSNLYTPGNATEVQDVNKNSFHIDGNLKLWLKWHSMLNNNLSDPESLAIKNADENQINFFKVEARSLVQDKDLSVFGYGMAPGYTRMETFFKQHGWGVRHWDDQAGRIINNPKEPPKTENFVLEFPYDWRIDIRKLAYNLNIFIQYVQKQSEFAGAPLFLMAHSTGGLISRAYLSNFYKKDLPSAPITLIKKQILIGTPNHGAPKAYRSLRLGTGFANNKGFMSRFPRNQIKLIADMPLIYQLLPDERYQSYFDLNSSMYDPTYLPLVTYEGQDSTCFECIRGTYIRSESTLKLKNGETIDSSAYTLNNDRLAQSALLFHKEIGEKTFHDDTYVFYSDHLWTPSQLYFSPGIDGKKPFSKVVGSYNGDGTVPAKSAYDLASICQADSAFDASTTDKGFDPTKYNLVNMSSVAHTQLPNNPSVLRMVLSIVNSV
jgi:hypothetical protein